MPNFDACEIRFKIIDDWEEIDKKWNYVNYMLILINDTIWLWEKKLDE